MTTILYIISKSIFFQMMYKFQLNNHCNLFLRVQLILNPNCFRQWHGVEQTLSHCLSQWWSRSMMHICISRIHWVDHFTVLGKYIDKMQRKKVLFEHTRDTFNPIAISNCQGGGQAGSRDGLTIFCKIHNTMAADVQKYSGSDSSEPEGFSRKRFTKQAWYWSVHKWLHQHKQCDLIIHPYPNFNTSLADQLIYDFHE